MGELVSFDDVISNFGSFYSAETYIFTCPVHGVYAFSIAINQYDRSDVRGILYRNNDELIRTTADNEGYFDSVSATVVAECNTGDQVFVVVDIAGNFDGTWSPSHFTGYLLHPLL